MEIWLDTIDITAIEQAALLGLLTGVTTNPGILSTAERAEDTLIQLLQVQPGKVAVQVIATMWDQMVEEGKRLFSFSDRFIIKIPVNQEGLRAIRHLSQVGIPTLGTAIFHPRQAFLAALAGADYVAPYFSHMVREGIDAFAALKVMRELFDAQMIATKIMIASLKQLDEIMKSAAMGIEAATLPVDLFTAFVGEDPLSEAATWKLHQKWRQSFGDVLISGMMHS
jgi:transaldolase